jgi:ribosome-binding factor A
MESTRQTRIGKQIQKDLAEIFKEQTNSLAPGKMLTITKVRITPDLGLAKANVSVFPSENSMEAINNLNLHVTSIRHELAKKIRHQLKKVPELKFYLDDSLDYIDNIDHLLND